MEEQNRKEIEMEVDEEVDDQEKTENSLNLNLSSVSDAENEGTIDDGRQQVVDNGKKRFNLFEKPPKENCVQAIQPRTEDGSRGQKKKAQEKKKPNKQVKDGKEKKKVAERKAPGKRNTRLPAKFLDGIDFSGDEIAPSLSFIRKLQRQKKTAADDIDPDWS